MGKPNNDRYQLLLFPAITLSLFAIAIIIGWIFGQLLPALGLLG